MQPDLEHMWSAQSHIRITCELINVTLQLYRSGTHVICTKPYQDHMRTDQCNSTCKHNMEGSNAICTKPDPDRMRTAQCYSAASTKPNMKGHFFIHDSCSSRCVGWHITKSEKSSVRNPLIKDFYRRVATVCSFAPTLYADHMRSRCLFAHRSFDQSHIRIT